MSRQYDVYNLSQLKSRSTVFIASLVASRSGAENTGKTNPTLYGDQVTLGRCI